LRRSEEVLVREMLLYVFGDGIETNGARVEIDQDYCAQGAICSLVQSLHSRKAIAAPCPVGTAQG